MVLVLDLEDYGEPLKLITRTMWGSWPRSDEDKGPPLSLPVVLVHFTQTGTVTGKNKNECMRLIQDLQAKHVMEEGASDIKYNFMVGGYGTVYEGRGWAKGAHRDGLGDSANCIDFAYIGTFDKNSQPPWEMATSILDFIKYSIRHNLISPYFRVV